MIFLERNVAMRVLIIYLMLLFSLSVFSVKPQQIIDSMVIKVAPWDAVTDIGIECSNFETSIDYQVCDEQNSCAISKIVSELNRLDKSLKGGEDMRCKIIFYHSGEALWSCCIGKITTKIESEYYYTSPSLIAVIDSIVNSHQTQLRKEVIEKWDYTPSLNKVYQYLTSQSGRLYDGIEIKEDLEFTVFCNVGEDGRTTNVQFTKNRNGKDKVIPVQITSLLEEILYHEIRWAVPPKHYADWVPIKISIKSNVSKNKTGAKANDSILVDKVWTERRTIFYNEEEMDSIGEGSIIEDGGIIAKYLSDSLVVYVNKAGEEIRIVPNMVCFDKGREGLIKELFSSLDISNEDYGGRVIFFILFNNMLQVQEIRVFEPLRPSYKANDLVIDKYVKYLEQTEGRWIRKENKQEWNLYIFSTVI